MNILGMNFRNHLIRRANHPNACRLAKDKAKTKELLADNDIPVPHTYAVLDIRPQLHFFSSLPNDFVIKPNHGAKGSGILVLKQHGDNEWSSPSGKIFSADDLLRHVHRILGGEFSGSRFSDQVLIEEVLYASEHIKFKDAISLPDIRIIISPFSPYAAMIRYPTHASDGKANLAKGALGIAVSAVDGEMYRVYDPGAKKEIPLSEIGIQPRARLPHWDQAMAAAIKCSEVTELAFIGVDFVLDQRDSWRVLEVNSSPGLEIQNITKVSLNLIADKTFVA